MDCEGIPVSSLNDLPVTPPQQTDELQVGDLVECDDDDFPIAHLRGKLHFQSGVTNGPFRIAEINDSGDVATCRLEGDGFNGCVWLLSNLRRASTAIDAKQPLAELRELLQGKIVCGNSLVWIYQSADSAESRGQIKMIIALLADIRDGKASP